MINKILLVLKLIYGENSRFFKRARTLYDNQINSSRGSACKYNSFDEWFVKELLCEIGYILIRDKKEDFGECFDFVQQSIYKRVDQQLINLQMDPIKNSELLRQHGKVALKNIWRRYFGGLKRSGAEALESFSLATALAKIISESHSKRSTALVNLDLVQADDDAAMYD